jgi:hypothetical protein
MSPRHKCGAGRLAPRAAGTLACEASASSEAVLLLEQALKRCKRWAALPSVSGADQRGMSGGRMRMHPSVR